MFDKPNANTQSPPAPITSDRRPKTAQDSKTSFFKRRTHLDDVKRDSGLAPSFVSSGKDCAADSSPDPNDNQQMSVPDTAVPFITFSDAQGSAAQDQEQDGHRPSTGPGSSVTLQQDYGEEVEEPFQTPSTSSAQTFSPLSTSIETGGFDDPFGEQHLSFSQRGSVLLDGQKALAAASRSGSVMSKKSPAMSAGVASPNLGIPQRSLSVEEKRRSREVHSRYKTRTIQEEQEEGLGIVAEDEGDTNTQQHPRKESGDDTNDTVAELTHLTSPSHHDLHNSHNHLSPRDASNGPRHSYVKMKPHEAAGGYENWENVNIGDVDRYGFIRPGTAKSRASSMGSSRAPGTPERSGRNSSQLDSPDEGSIRHRKLRRPPPDSSRTKRLSMTSNGAHSDRPASRATSHAPSAMSQRSRRSVKAMNKHRRWVDEAPDMLGVQPGMPEHSQGPIIPEAEQTATEKRRADKWQKMARPVNEAAKASSKPAVGAGQVFMFDTKSPKLIERVWKGIPDIWRASAWYAFLTTSSKALHKSKFVPDEELIRRYRVHLTIECIDDSQIDTDVDRTVGQHVMFRSRYEGGQKLLFNVLRALSLEYPHTGYAQGMGPLVATLLSYFQEERAFVVACRMWSDRGIATLFDSGFVGLHATLKVFEDKWLAQSKSVKQQLDKLEINPTLFGTKWYLTLFNMTLPFQAQLRVWDVFMLLGGPQHTVKKADKDGNSDDGSFDILHATAMALMDALQEVLVDAEMENAMTALTSKVDVVNEDVLMKVTKREYDERQKRRRKGK